MQLGNLIYTTQKQWRLPVVCFGAFCIAFFGFIPGMGLPGAILLIATDSILQMLGTPFGYRGFLFFSHGDDYVWPAAILLTWSLAPILVIAYAIAFRALRTKPTWQKWLAYFAVILALGIAVTLWMYQSIATSSVTHLLPSQI